MKRVQAFFFRYRNFLAALPLPYAMGSLRWEWEDEGIIWLLAILLCAAGVALRSWAVCHCNYGQGRKKCLVTTGPYAYIRNPLYVGNLAILAGATIASELAWLLPASLIWAFLVYNAAIRHEESRLEAKYGEAFLRYRKTVPAWIPWFGLPSVPFARALRRQSWAFLLLLPFLIKELVVDVLFKL